MVIHVEGTTFPAVASLGAHTPRHNVASGLRHRGGLVCVRRHSRTRTVAALRPGTLVPYITREGRLQGKNVYRTSIKSDTVTNTEEEPVT